MTTLKVGIFTSTTTDTTIQNSVYTFRPPHPYGR